MQIGEPGYEELVSEIFPERKKETGSKGNDNPQYFQMPCDALFEHVKKSLDKGPFKKNVNSKVFVSKIILGVFGRSLVFDQYASRGLLTLKNSSSHNLTMLDRTTRFKKSMALWEEYSKSKEAKQIFGPICPKFLGSNEKYPIIRTIDMYLWYLGCPEDKRQIDSRLIPSS